MKHIIYHTNLYTQVEDSPSQPLSDEQPKSPGEASKVQKAIQDSRDIYVLPQEGRKQKRKEVGIDTSDGAVEGGGVAVASSLPKAIRVKGQVYKLALQKTVPPVERRLEKLQPLELTVAYLWIISELSGEKVHLYMQILQPHDKVADVLEEMADFAELDWDDDYVIGKVGVAKPRDILRGEEFQDAMDQLGREGRASISTSTPRGRQIPKRLLVPSRAKTVAQTIRVKGQLYKLAEKADTAGSHTRIKELRELRQSWDDGEIDGEEYLEKLRKLEEKPKKEAQTLPEVIKVKGQLYKIES